MYCGNNRLNSQLIENGGQKILGTRYSCMRNGYGRGIHEPVDLSYNNPYQPIDERKFYCGNDEKLPEGYHDFGTLHSCFLKGFGTGKKKRAQQGLPGPNPPVVPVAPVVPVVPVAPVVPNSYSKLIIYILLYLSLNAVFIISMLYTKPSFITKEDHSIDWQKLSPYIALFSVVLLIVMYFSYTLIIH